MNAMFSHITIDRPWRNVARLTCGFSQDEKYCIEGASKTHYMLCVYQPQEAEKAFIDFQRIKSMNHANLIMPKAVACGYTGNGDSTYTLLSWVEGQTLDKLIRTMTPQEQYQMGLRAGDLLHRLHDLEVDAKDRPVIDMRAKKLKDLKDYERSPLRYEDDEDIVEFIHTHLDHIAQTPLVYEHSDFHLGNLVLNDQDTLGFIDFNGSHIGDRYEEFYKIDLFTIELSLPFSIGQLHGYFKGEPPLNFWKAHAVYTAHAALYGMKWAEDHGAEIFELERYRGTRIIKSYQRFTQCIPDWYITHKNDFK